MEKRILEQYIDACELIRETERDIRRLEKRHKATHFDKVTGSNPDFPYEERHYTIEGLSPTAAQDEFRLKYEKRILIRRKKEAEDLKIRVEEWMLPLPQRYQRLIRMRFFDCLTWEEIASRMGRKATAESVRKELERFLADF